MEPEAPSGLKRGLEPPPAALEAMDQQDVACGAKRQRGEEVAEEFSIFSLEEEYDRVRARLPPEDEMRSRASGSR